MENEVIFKNGLFQDYYCKINKATVTYANEREQVVKTSQYNYKSKTATIPINYELRPVVEEKYEQILKMD